MGLSAMSQTLIDEFCVKLDEALVLAISSEYDLEDEESRESVRAVLSSLAQHAEVEEATGFNPDGLGTGQRDSATDDLTDPKSSRETSQTKDNSGALGSLTSSGTSFTGGESDDDAFVPRIVSFDDSSEEDKNKQLAFMFPSLKQSQVDASLKEEGGDFQAALDRLLTLQYLQSTEVKSKAIDAFFRPEDEEEYEVVTKKGKKKRRKGGAQASAAAREKQIEREADSVNNIMYITERLNLPFESVADAYHRNKRSREKATVALLDPFISQGVEAQGDAASARVKELQKKHKSVPAEYLSATVQIADAIPQWADDVAALLEKHFAAEAVKGPLAVSYSLTPIEDEVEDGFTAVTAKKNGVGKENVRGTNDAYSSAASLNGLSSASLRTQATSYEQARLSASAAAAHAVRKGRSNHLYRQAAAVYAERARENGLHAAAASSQAAHRLVAERRTRDCIDLHGVTVRDGVGIAKGAVKNWYDSLGEYKAREARRGFTVITGIGRHSQGGVSRMRQAVCAALINEGWRVEVGTGKFMVTGRR